MKFAVVCLLVVLGVVYAAARPEDGADKVYDRFDSIDVDQVLKSDRLLKNYFNCLMEQGKCTAEGADLKKVIPEALENECAKCTEGQRDKILKVIKFLVNNKPEMWDKLMEKYDPKKMYRTKYEKQAKEHEIPV